ncbi:MAG: HAMP domain-containing histidine kinase [Bacteroidetes bacterium]|nr:HAMP domain-containing histidine kinase [Bacteroidota bacterium]
MKIARLEESARVSAIKYEEEIRQIQDSGERAFRIYLISLIAAVVLISSVALYLLRGQRQSRLEVELWSAKVAQFEDFKERLFVILSQDIHLIMPRLDELGKRATNETESSDVQQLKSSLGQLLQWVSLQSGAMPFRPETFDYKPFLDERLKIYEARFHTMGIRVEWFTPDALSIYADRQMLEIIFNQLITNALRFVQSGGAITFFAGQKDGLTTLGVRDTGKGIGKEELEGMFRSSGGSELDYKGQGLGLILCKDLIERHGGRMYVESTPGSGSSFYFTLPQHKKS